MKKMLLLLLLLACISSVSVVAFAANDIIPPFDYTKLQGVESGFELNSDTGEWSWQHSCTMNYTDASVRIGFRTVGKSNPEFVCLYAWMHDLNKSKFASVSAVDIVVGEETYSFKSMMENDEESYVPLGQNGNLLIEAIAYCNPEEVKIIIYYDDSSLSVPFTASMIESSLKTYCLEYVRKGVWLYNIEKNAIEQLEVLYPLFVNGAHADYSTMHVDHRDIIKPITMEDIMPESLTNSNQDSSGKGSSENTTGVGIAYEKANGTKISTGIYIGGRDIPVGRYYAVLDGHLWYGRVIVYPDKQNYLDYEENFSGTRLTEAYMYNSNSYCCVFEITDGCLLSVEVQDILAWREIPITEINGETVVPMGCYQVGRDIPAGRYSARLFDGTQRANISVFEDFQNFVKYQENYSGNRIFFGNPYYDDECVFELEDGEFLYIEHGDLIVELAKQLIFN